MITIVSTSSVDYHTATDTEANYLLAVADDAEVLEIEDVTNASGKTVGNHYTITDGLWDFIQESVARYEDDRIEGEEE